MMLVTTVGVYKNSSISRYANNHTNFGSNILLFSDIEEIIKNNDIDKIKKLPDLYMVDNKYNTLLHSSAKFNKPEISMYLLYKNLNPNQKNLHGKTPFTIACAKGNHDHVAQFLLYNADVNTSDNLMNSPLHYSWNSPEIIKLLLNSGANPYAINDFDQTPVVLSLKNTKSLETYMSHGVNPNLANSNHQTLLHSAIIQNNTDAADVLKKYNADINYKDNSGRSALFYAKTPETLKWLISNKAKINITDKNGQTALHYNVINNNAEIAKYLIKYKANPNIKDNNNLPPIGYAKTIKMMKLLLDNGADPNVITPKGNTILHNVTKTNNLKGVYYLLQAKANPNIPDKDGKLPIEYTTSQDIYTLLLGSGTNPNYKNYLKKELLKKNFENISNLLECGANPNFADSKGNNAVFYINNSKELELLKQYNANLDFVNANGYTPILHFALLGDKNKVDLLKTAGAQRFISANNETIDDCLQKYNKYHCWLKQTKQQPTFTGDFSYKNYGTAYERNQLNYKIELTTDKINEIIYNAKTTDEGLVTVYNMLKKEENHIYEAINSLNVIFKQYRTITKEDLNALVRKNPSGSKIPGIAIIRQVQETVLSDNFKNEILNDIEKLRNNYNEIVDNYYSKNIKNMVIDYIALNDYVTEGIKYTNYMQGTSKTRVTILDKLENNKQKCLIQNQKCQLSINKRSENYEKLYNKIIQIQDKKQKRRTTKKVILKVVTLGLS